MVAAKTKTKAIALAPEGADAALETVMATVAAALSRRREHAGLSRRALAQAAGVHEDVIQKIELGHRLPELKSLILLAHALGAQIASFFKA